MTDLKDYIQSGDIFFDHEIEIRIDKEGNYEVQLLLDKMVLVIKERGKYDLQLLK